MLLLFNRRRYYGAKPFDPLSLFANGEQGAWYDPSDLTTLFQDDAGTIPVTADGDPVGLMLDKSRGLVMGQEEIDLSAGSVVTVGDAVGSYDPVTHTLTSDGSGTGQVRLLFSGFDASKKYAITVVLSGDVADLALSGTFFTSGQRIDPTSGTFSAIVDGSPSLRLISIEDGTKASSVTIESASVRELPGNHASQATASNRPIYRTDGTLHWLEGDGIDDSLVFSMTGLDGAPAASALMGIEDLGSDTLGAAFFLNTIPAASVNKLGMWVPRSATEWSIRGNDGANVDVSFTKPTGAAVFSGIWSYDGTSPLLVARLNGAVAVEYSATTKSGGVAADASFSLFSRNGGTNCSGKLFQFICVEGGPGLDAAESYIATKSGVTL